MFAKFTRGLSLLLACVMVFTLAACTAAPEDTKPAGSSAPTTEPTVSTTAPTLPVVETDNPLTYFYASIVDEEGNAVYLSAMDNQDETAAIEYAGQVKKVATMDAQVLHGITVELAKTGLESLVGKDQYEEGGSSVSVFVEFSDGTSWGVGFSGTIPQEFMDGYEMMDTYFQQLTANTPLYVPTPMVTDEVNEGELEAMLEILELSAIDTLDQYVISNIVTDETFGVVAGLAGNHKITSGAKCGAMMMTTPYSLVIVTLEDGEDKETVRNDFEENLGWQNWVCVMPTDALIAEKDNMVLCLMGSGKLFGQTKSGIEQAGWSSLETFKSRCD